MLKYGENLNPSFDTHYSGCHDKVTDSSIGIEQREQHLNGPQANGKISNETPDCRSWLSGCVVDYLQLEQPLGKAFPLETVFERVNQK
nr:hypothetical protein [Hymenobacter sp. CRA2]